MKRYRHFEVGTSIDQILFTHNELQQASASVLRVVIDAGFPLNFHKPGQMTERVNRIEFRGCCGMPPAQAAKVTGHQWTMEEVVEMMDAHQKAQEEAAFEQAFSETHWTPKRRSFATEPTPKDQIPLPWYLDPNGQAPDVMEKGLTD